MTKKSVTVFIILCLWAKGLFAATLADIYELAVKNDPQLAAAQASFNAQSEVITLRRASLLPSISMSGQTSDSRNRIPLPPTGIDSDPTSPTFGQIIALPGSRPTSRFNSHGWGATLSQQLFNLSTWYRFKQGQDIEAQAASQFAAEQQALIVRVVESYLAILEAQAALTSANAERNAVQRQLEQVQQRFDVGLVAITDVLESQAAYDNSTVTVIEREGAQNISFEALLRLTGNPISEVSGIVEEMPIEYPQPNNVDEWINRAVASNFTLKAAREGLNSAQKEVKIARSGHLPTIGAQVSWNHNATGGGNSFFGSKSDTRTLGMQINIPIYSGGAVSAGARQAGFSLDQAQKNYDLQQRQIVEQTRNLFTAINTDVARVRARLRGIESSQSALDATQTGYEVGTRNVVDVLNGQRSLFLAQFQYASARYQYIRDTLALKAVVGSLSPEDVYALGDYISPEAVNRVTPSTR